MLLSWILSLGSPLPLWSCPLLTLPLLTLPLLTQRPGDRGRPWLTRTAMADSDQTCNTHIQHDM